MFALNLKNKRFGKLIVLERSENRSGSRKAMWLCLCDCGNTKTIAASSLVSKNGTKSCGCLKKNQFNDLTGKIVNNLTIQNLVGKNKYSCWIYEVLCFCGKTFIAEGNDVNSAKIKSCGCNKVKNLIKKMKTNPELGMSNSIRASYKNKAKKRGLQFNIGSEDFFKLITSNCEYCGTTPLNVKVDSRKNSNNNSFLYNGIDRINNNVGYVLDNCVSCCFVCNQAKHTLNVDFFKSWVKRIYCNLKEKGRL